MKSNDWVVYLDAGHGGIDPKTGKYHSISNGKKAHFPGHTFHGNGWFYEGVWNRTFNEILIKKLQEHHITVKKVYHPYLDITLQKRVAIVNWHHKNWRPGFLLSNHANAFNGRARGFEIYTSPGETKSDWIAQRNYRHVEDLLGDQIIMRPDLSDGDHDKEARFFMLTRTACPAILVENLFFDNLQDAQLLMDPLFMEDMAEAQLRTIIEYQNESFA